MDAEEEELFQMNVIHNENSNLYKLLLNSMTSDHYAVFKSLLKRGLDKKPPSININYTYPFPLDKSLLDIAACQGKSDFVQLLLDYGVDPNKINDKHNRGPIHFASEFGYHDVIEKLLDDTRTNPNLEVHMRETALHFAVRKNNTMCVKVLLENYSSPNIPNTKGITPLHVAVQLGYRDIIDLIMKNSRLQLDIDNFHDVRKKTTRDLLTEKYPDINLPSRDDFKIDFNVLRFYLDANDELNFLQNLDKIGEKDMCDTDKLIVLCAERNFCQAIGKLLEKKGSEGDDKLPYEAIEVAIRRGNHGILMKYLKNDCKVDGDLVLIAARELGVPCRSGFDGGARLKCLKILLDQPGVNVRCEDDKGNTALHYAARAEEAEAVQLLLESGSYIGHKNVLGVLPIANISPSLLSDHLDNCLRSNNDRSDEYEIEFDYQCLMPHSISLTPEDCVSENYQTNYQRDYPATMEMEPLRFISENPAMKHLLKHPILSSFLALKWHRIRHILYANFVFYVIFYLLLNFYIVFMASSNEKIIDKSQNDTKNEINSSEEILLTSWHQPAMLWTLSASFLIFLGLREAMQFLSSPLHYIQSIENWLEVTLIVSSTAVLTGAGQQFGAIVILLSAWELIVLIGQHPKMSTSIQMFKTVTLNFMKFLFLYAFLIFAFALSFFTLFKNVNDDDNFPDLGRSLFKTIIMLTGEFDASNIPFTLYPFLSRFIFVLFVFLIAIVLFNLLNGLAVSDTAEILGKAQLVGLVSRTQLVSYAERVSIGENANFSDTFCYKLLKKRIGLLGFMVKRLLMFPNYIPYGKISVKPYKSNEIKIYGKNYQNKGCRNSTMDEKIVNSAKEILSRENFISEGGKIINQLSRINQRINHFENILQDIKVSLKDNSDKD